MQGKLSVVATPIGNLGDITARALRVLAEADFIACENVANTRKLLAHFDIHTPAVSDRKALALIAQGKHVALVSDAGTPTISDPGGDLVAAARAAGAFIEAVPGPSAFAAALSVSGLRAPSFVFYGFLPQKKGREKLFKEIATEKRAVIFYESPHRIMKTLESLAKGLHADRRIGVFRELTKVYEESTIGTAVEVLDFFTEHTEKQRGEFVVVVEAA
jgi:16S rRNA (cytidine1402-2'-O)-methyltransferase